MSNLPKPLYYLVIIVIGLGSYFGGRFIVESLITQYQLNQATSRADNANSEPVVPVEEARNQFDQGCLNVDFSGLQFDQRQYCVCVFNALEQSKGVNWIIKAGLNIDDPEVMNVLTPVTTDCLRQQNLNV